LWFFSTLFLSASFEKEKNCVKRFSLELRNSLYF